MALASTAASLAINLTQRGPALAATCVVDRMRFDSGWWCARRSSRDSIRDGARRDGLTNRAKVGPAGGCRGRLIPCAPSPCSWRSCSPSPSPSRPPTRPNGCASGPDAGGVYDFPADCFGSVPGGFGTPAGVVVADDEGWQTQLDCGAPDASGTFRCDRTTDLGWDVMARTMEIPWVGIVLHQGVDVDGTLTFHHWTRALNAARQRANAQDG